MKRPIFDYIENDNLMSLVPFQSSSIKPIIGIGKEYGYICDECNNMFKSSLGIISHRCKVCEKQVCQKCVRHHYIHNSDICKVGIYNFRTDSIKRLKNWSFRFIQICCPKCNIFKIERFDSIRPLSYVCSDSRCRENTNITCSKKPKYDPFIQYQEGLNDPIILYKRTDHTKLCYVCEEIKCSCFYHKCPYINVPKFYPRIAYIYSPFICEVILCILCCFRKSLPEIHRDVIWKNVINKINWTIET